ncbi:MAG: hypothetical protein PHU53_02000 [Thermoplasmata archaeon]|nr:hypothetical protein [Thermoplasmata archaeon]
MPFCGFCGAPKEDEKTVCAKCNKLPIQQPSFYYGTPMQAQNTETGNIVMIVMAIITAIVVVTIILALVLYVMVAGFGGESPPLEAPVGSWTMEPLSDDSGKITFSVFSDSVAPTDINIYVQADGENIGQLIFTGDSVQSPAPMTWVGGPAGASATYTDYNPAGGTINGGDNIVLNGLESGTEYSFMIYHIPSDEFCQMTSQSFTTEP